MVSLRTRGALGLAALSVAALLPAPAGSQGNYHGRRAWTVSNDKIAVVVTPGGGHIASLTLLSGRGAGINPLWLPPWQSVEPGAWRTNPAGYGDRPAAQLLSTILGHNICVDFFGGPSPAETKAGVPVHGEAPTVNWLANRRAPGSLTYSAALPLAQMRVSRSVRLAPGSSALWITETVTNDTAFDRPFGWQQHPTFGPPFTEKGVTFFDMPATKGKVYPKEFSKTERLRRGAEFEWPNAPLKSGDDSDLRVWPPKEAKNSDFVACLMDPSREWAYVTAVNTRRGVVVGYVWPRKDWPWAAIWEENHARTGKPWLGRALARGVEFGTTPFADSRKDAVTLGSLFGTPTYRWISAGATQRIGYGAFIAPVPPGTTGVSDVRVQGNRILVKLDGVDRTLTLAVRK